MGLPDNCGFSIRSKYEKGRKNLITDVPGVKVGHVTLNDREKHIHTGITAILPHEGNLFREKVMAGVSVINGFGKSAGLIQVEELGTIEAPILMTNTFGVGTCLNGVLEYMLAENPDIGVSTGTINCVVTECNDGPLNDIRGMHLQTEHVIRAIENAGTDFEEGAVGSGTGMICMGLKGGIGSASRIVVCDGREYVIGALVMSNFGVEGNLRIDGRLTEPADSVFFRTDPDGEAAGVDHGRSKEPGQESISERGSVIIVLATDIPLNERQLKRMAGRGVVGITRTGSYLGNGSGDIAIAFSNANRVPHYSQKDILDIKMFHDEALDKVFEAVGETVEEAVVSSLYHGETMQGIRGKTVRGLVR